MNEALQKSNPATCGDMFSATSLRESPVGHSHFVSPDGLTTDLFGAPLSPVNLGASQAKEREPQTIATSGAHTSGSFANSSLSISLANKLKQRLNLDGSMEYRLTWKQKATPSGRLYYLLRASERPTQDTEFSGWPTPRSEDSEISGARVSRGIADTLTAVSRLAGWCSPTAMDANRGANPPRPQDSGIPLSQMAGMSLSGWSTPAQDAKNSTAPPSQFNRNSEALPIQVHGVITESSISQTENRGVLNPALSRWLQGFPKEFCECAIRAYRSILRKHAQCDCVATGTP